MSQPDLPSRIGPYEILAELGRGGMGAVYRARHAETRAPAALKVMLALRREGGLSERALARFKRELEVLARLEHPGIVRVHSAGQNAGIPWVAMELIDGESLDAHLRHGPLPPRAAVERARLLDALDRVLENEDDLDSAEELAELVRPGGTPAAESVSLVREILGGHRRIAALATVLFGREPELTPSPEMVRPLALAIAGDSTGVVRLPRGDRAFEAVVGAPGLDDETRGAILLRRAERLIARGPEWFEAALAVSEGAAELGARAAPGSWPDEFVLFSGRVLAERLSTEAPGAPRLENLVAWSGAGRDPIDRGTLTALRLWLIHQVAARVDPWPEREEGEAFLEHVLAVFAYLERHGFKGAALANPITLFERLGEERVAGLIADELARPAGARRPSVLLALLRFVLDLYDHAALGSPSVSSLMRPAAEALLDEGPEARWRFAIAADSLRAVQAIDVAGRAAERADELDRSRPLEERWPVIGETRGWAWLLGPEIDVDAGSGERLLRHVQEVAALQLLLRARSAGDGQERPWVADRAVGIRELAVRVVERFLAARGAECPEGHPAPIEDLLADVAELDDHPDVWRLRGRHHHLHGRHERAVADLSKALGGARNLLSESANGLVRRESLLRVAVTLLWRAEALAELGRHDAAERDRAAAVAADRKAREIR